MEIEYPITIFLTLLQGGRLAGLNYFSNANFIEILVHKITLTSFTIPASQVYSFIVSINVIT